MIPIRTISKVLAVMCLVAAVPPMAEAQDMDCARNGMACRFWMPTAYNANTRYPLVVYLHGAGQSGSDNLHIREWNNVLAPFIGSQRKSFVLAPQCPAGQQWVNWPWEKGSYDHRAIPESEALKNVRAMIEGLRSKYPIDSDRIYVVGWSMGGFGTWDLIARTPSFFAGALPVMGGGSPSAAPALRNMAVWSSHNADDTSVPVSSDREMFAAMARAGGRPIYTEGKDGGHFQFIVPGQPGQIEWLFNQRRGQPDTGHPDLSFTPAGGTFPGAVSVVLKAGPGAEIRHTNNLEVPTRALPVSTGPVAITSSAVLMATATTYSDDQPTQITTFHAAPFTIGNTPQPDGTTTNNTGGISGDNTGGISGDNTGGTITDSTGSGGTEEVRGQGGSQETPPDSVRGGCSQAKTRHPPHSLFALAFVGWALMRLRGRRG